MQISQKSIIITGANRGIGYALAEALLLQEDKFEVIFTSRTEEKGKESIEKIIKKHPEVKERITFFSLDVTSEESINKLITKHE